MTDSAHPEAADSLSRKVGLGLGWSFLNNVVSRLGTVLSGIVLARLLVPEDFGVFAVALVVLNAGLSMNELGVSLAVVRWSDGVERIAPTVTTMALAWSGLLYAASFVAAPLLASALNAPSATVLIRVLSLGILIDALACVPAALITRHFMQRTRMGIDLASFVAGTGTSIVLAILGAGAWSFVWGFVVTSTVSAGLALVLAPARYRPGFDPDAARALLSFGVPLAGSSVLLFLMVNIDYVVVGRLLGSEPLGYYLLAFNLCSWPVALISVAVRRVSLAGFSRVATDPDRAGAAFTRSAGLVAAVTVPLCAALAAYAPAVIELLYGARWLPSARTLQFLCALGAARVAAELAYDYLVAMGRTRANLGVQVLWVALLVPALVIGAREAGIVGVAVAHALVAIGVVMPTYLIVLRRNRVRVRSLAREAGAPLLVGLLVLATGSAVVATVTGALPTLLVGGVVTALVALPLLRRCVTTARAMLARPTTETVAVGVVS